MWFLVLPALRLPSPVKPPPFRHRNSPSCEMKVPEFKIVTGCYLYSSRKDVLFSAAVYFVVVPTAGAASSRLWGQVGGERGLQVWGVGTRPAQKCLVVPAWSRTIWPQKKVHGLGEVSS